MGLPPSDGITTILIVVDCFCKAVYFIPLPKLTSTAKSGALLLRHIFHLHGFPRDIVSDANTALKSGRSPVVLRGYSEPHLWIPLPEEWPLEFICYQPSLFEFQEDEVAVPLVHLAVGPRRSLTLVLAHAKASQISGGLQPHHFIQVRKFGCPRKILPSTWTPRSWPEVSFCLLRWIGS